MNTTLYTIGFIIACTISYFWGKKVGRQEIIEIEKAYKAGVEAAHGITKKMTRTEFNALGNNEERMKFIRNKGIVIDENRNP